MSDREFTGFDVETVAEAVRQPPLGHLRRAARLRRRRRAAGAGLAVVVALAGSFLVPSAGDSGGVNWAGTDPADPPTERGVSELFLLTERIAVGVEVRDPCQVSFTATEDAGRVWSEWRTAEYDGACGTTPDAEGLGVSDVRYTVLDERTYLVSVDGQAILSTDGGRTWRDAESAVTDVQAFPARARPVTCQNGCGAMTRPLAVDPGTDTVYRLADLPATHARRSVDRSDDGALWFVEASPEFGGAATVASTVDRGATWRTSQVPEGVTPIALGAVSGREAYLLTEPRATGTNGPPTGSSRLLHTTDAGRTWADVGTDLPTSSMLRPFTVGRDGVLLVGEQFAGGATAYVWVSRDGGRHFVRGERVGTEGTAGVAPGLVWLGGRDDPSQPATAHVQVSADGETWSRLPLPQ
ncbi:WD40/YVTN/BNR-like repeat-containing protein [Micromonospora sp. NPDC047620]|uniref:WD40/YVTN/BNR-like repeat-containing protein n=1 Tax=Micromonospora sp. NPDC047620 TaxID=3364251 RepID=UPI00371390C8